MRHFDDIPISQIQKMPGYQTGDNMPKVTTMMEEYPNSRQTNAGALGSLEDEDAQCRPIEERTQNAKWNIRLAAYKEMNNLFYNDYA